MIEFLRWLFTPEPPMTAEQVQQYVYFRELERAREITLLRVAAKAGPASPFV